MSPLSTPSQQGYHVQTVKPLIFILQLPNSSVRCNCASHQPELGCFFFLPRHECIRFDIADWRVEQRVDLEHTSPLF